MGDYDHPITQDQIEQIQRLERELSETLPRATSESLCAATEDGTNVTLVAEHKHKDILQIVGMATLIRYYHPLVGRVGVIEAVSVLPEFQKQGIGTVLIEHLLGHARQTGVKRVTLTSNDLRKTAHRLYQRAGFEKVDTNVFSLKL
jgi:GNAT superfamily N-acetyltransferase